MSLACDCAVQHLPPPPPPILNPGPISQAATYSGAQVALLMHVDESGDAVGRPPATTVIRDTIGLTLLFNIVRYVADPSFS